MGTSSSRVLWHTLLPAPRGVCTPNLPAQLAPAESRCPAKWWALTGCAPGCAPGFARAEHETESRRGEQPGDGRGEPAASAGKSRGFSVPRRGRERGMGGGSTRPPAGPASRASWSSATCTEDTQRRHQGTRGALAPFLDAILRRRDEGWHTRVAPVDPGLSSALPASLETKTVWDRIGRRCSLCRRRLRTQGVQPPFPQCSPGWREGRKEK